MPFNKLSVAAMTAESVEYLDLDNLAERLEVSNRTIERLIKVFAKKLKKNRRRRGRTMEYLWSDILKCAKLYLGIETESTPSIAVKRGYTKQRVKELEAEVDRLTQENNRLQSEQTD